MLIEFVGSTGNPQVQQAALLLASHTADVAPELLLHNMMPIFTFASKGVMRNDDGFSIHVVEKVCRIIIVMIIDSTEWLTSTRLWQPLYHAWSGLYINARWTQSRVSRNCY